MEIDRGSTRSRSVGNWLWKRLWSYGTKKNIQLVQYRTRCSRIGITILCFLPLQRQLAYCPPPPSSRQRPQVHCVNVEQSARLRLPFTHFPFLLLLPSDARLRSKQKQSCYRYQQNDRLTDFLNSMCHSASIS